MKNPNIDWNGNCEFDEKGMVIGFKHQSPTNSYSMTPIPQSEAIINDAKHALSVIENMTKLITIEGLALILKRLSVHCGLQLKNEQEIASLTLDYYHDLKDYPAKVINDACNQYRQLPEGNNFMPSSGKLISMMENRMFKIRDMKVKMNKILGVSPVKKISIGFFEGLDMF